MGRMLAAAYPLPPNHFPANIPYLQACDFYLAVCCFLPIQADDP